MGWWRQWCKTKSSKWGNEFRAFAAPQSGMHRKQNLSDSKNAPPQPLRQLARRFVGFQWQNFTDMNRNFARAEPAGLRCLDFSQALQANGQSRRAEFFPE